MYWYFNIYVHLFIYLVSSCAIQWQNKCFWSIFCDIDQLTVHYPLHIFCMYSYDINIERI